MASGWFMSNSGTYLNIVVNWSSVPNTLTNSSEVTINQVYVEYVNISSSAGKDIYVTCNGEEISAKSPSMHRSGGTGKASTILFANKKFTVSHNEDGKKNITIKAGFKFSGKYSGKSINWLECSATVSLDAIARAATITSANDITIGENCDIDWKPTSSKYYYKFKFRLENQNTFLHTTEAISVNSTSEQTYNSYNFDYNSWISGVPTQRWNCITELRTYSDSACTKQIGSTSSRTFKLYAPQKSPDNKDLVPSISSFTITSKTENQYLQSCEKVGLPIPVAGLSCIEAVCYAQVPTGTTIESYNYEYLIPDGLNEKVIQSYTKASNNSTDTYKSEIIEYSGAITVKCTVKDRRGRTASTRKSINFKKYVAPILSKFVAERNDTGGIDITYNYSFTKFNVDENENGVKVVLCYKKSSDSVETQIDLIQNFDTTTPTDNITKKNVITAAEDSAYNFTLKICDKISYWETAKGNYSSSMSAFIPPKEVTVDFKAGGRGISLGQMATREGLDVYMPSYFNKEVTFSDAVNFRYSGEVLWEDANYMNSSQIVDLSEKPISATQNGIVLVFSRFDEAVKTDEYPYGTPYNDNIQSFFVSKWVVQQFDGVGYTFNLSNHWSNGSFGSVGSKFLRIFNEQIKGDDDNVASGTKSGIDYDNKKFVLRYVIAV